MKVTLKAYIVDCDGENGGKLYFAKTRGQAKARAANEESCQIIDVISCKRAPELDKYAPGPVPPKVLLEMGWWFECYGCLRHVTAAGEDYDYERDEELVPVVEPAKVWCSVQCKHRSLLREWKHQIAHNQRKIELLAALEHGFRGAAFIDAPYSGVQPSVIFSVPGTTTHVQWTVGSRFVSVAPIDREAWHRYEDSRLADVYAWENEGGLIAS